MKLNDLIDLTGLDEYELRTWSGGLKIRSGKKYYNARLVRDKKGEAVMYLDKDGKARFFRYLKNLKESDIARDRN